MFGCFGRSKKKNKKKKAGKEPDKFEEPTKKPQQAIGTDTNTCIVINGAGGGEITPSERNEDEGLSERSHRYHVDGKNDLKKGKVLKDDSSSTSRTNSSDESSDDMNGAPPMGYPTSAGSHGQGGNKQKKSKRRKGHTSHVSYTGENFQFGDNSSIKVINISKDKTRKKKSKKGQADAISSSKESAAMPKSCSMPEDTSEVTGNVGKLQKSLKEPSTANDNVIQVRLLGRPPGSSAGNMRAQSNETDTVSNLRLLVNIAPSIGIISSPHGKFGTGFRVGPSYIMTAKHVKDNILNAVPSQLCEPSPPPRINHLNDVYIDFSYEVSTDDKQSIHTDDNHKFYFEPKIVYENDNMDTVILQLKPNIGMVFPPPLTDFAELSDPNGQLYLIGHSKAEIKRIDKFRYVQLTSEENTSARQWSQQHIGIDGYTGIDNPQRVLLHCTFEKGASGSPGVWICSNTHHAYIVTMLLCGYPGWYYDNDYPLEKKHRIPHEFLVEQGVCMRSLYEDIKSGNPDLCQEIFCYNMPVSPNDDVEMTSM